MSNYHEAFKKLNDQQKQAVTSIEGPVMVIAGPGTGKTQVIASRIAYILENTDANPKNILCLTYTESGTVAMKNRLIEFIGPTGHDVRISTFHGFCNEIIQENAEYFGYKELQPIDDLERVHILKKIIDSFDKDNPLKRFKGAVYYDLKNLKNLFSVMRKEGLTFKSIKLVVEDHLAELATSDEMFYKRNGKGFKKGDFKQQAFDKEKEKYDKLLAGAAEFEGYLKLCKKNGFYDFDDMILWVKDAFIKNDFILKRYQERYQYILVDEYQDTNGSQNEVVELLASYFENPNLFVVGDDDQSIYRFQGANMDNIIDFQNRYKNSLQTIPMTTNYRSTQQILDGAMQLIGHNESRILSGDQKKLTAGHPERMNVSGQTKVLEFNNRIQEYAHIGNHIREAYKKQPDVSNIAVIYRNHKDAELLIDYLQKNQVPVNAARSVNILNEPLFQNLLDLLTYFQTELDQPYSRKTQLFELLTLPWFNLDYLTISNFSYWARIQLNKWIYEPDEDRHRKYHWRYLLNNLQDAQSVLSADEIKKLTQVNARLESLLSSASKYTLPQFIGLIFDECQVLEWIMKSDQKEWNLEVYRAFFDFVKTESWKNPRLDFDGLFAILRTMKDEDLSIELSKTLIDRHGVNFITAHASKGLEFETVFVINTTDKSWNAKSRSYGFKFPPNLIQLNTDEEKITEEEARRLFYVAMTRAEKNLFVCYSNEDEHEKSQLPSKFVNELLADSDIVHREMPQVDQNDLINFTKTVLEHTISTPQLVQEDWLHNLLENYHLSATDLNIYLNCPVAFYYEKVLRIPAAKHSALSLGSATHEAIELFIKTSKDEKRVIEKDEFLQLYSKALDKERSSLTHQEYENFLEYGNTLLTAYYELKLIESNLPNITQELNVRARIGDETLIKGMMDKVEEAKNELLVVDYKTGKFRGEKFKKPGEKPNDEKINLYGGDYWRQAVFYSLLIENSDRHLGKNVNQVSFEFLETAIDKFREEIVEINYHDRVFVNDLSQKIFRQIKNLEFDNGCGEKDCKWCQLDNV